MNTHGGVYVKFHSNLLLRCMELSGQFDVPATLYPTKRDKVLNCIGDWVGPIASLDHVAKDMLSCMELNPGLSSHIHSLYCLSNPCS